MTGFLATRLDGEMLRRNGANILPPLQPEQNEGDVPRRPGTAVARELGNRYLMRYVLANDERYLQSSRKAYVTPTLYSEHEAVDYLVLPPPFEARPFVVLLDPALIPWIKGPLEAAYGGGIQYILPDGYTIDAVIVPGAPGAHWLLPVR